MILKVMSTNNSWILLDNLENVTIHQNRYSVDYISSFEKLELYVLDDDNPYKIALVTAQKGHEHVRVAFNTYAYLMSDGGKTVEHIQAEKGPWNPECEEEIKQLRDEVVRKEVTGLVDEKLQEEIVPKRVEEAYENYEAARVALQDLLLFLKINRYQLGNMSEGALPETDDDNCPLVAIPKKVAAKLLPHI